MGSEPRTLQLEVHLVEPNRSDTGKGAAGVAEYLAWPGFALITLVVFGYPIVKLLAAVRHRVADPKTSVALTKDGFTIQTFQEGKKELQTAVTKAEEEPTVPIPPNRTAEQLLEDLTQKYLGTHSDDHRERTSAKDKLGRQMGGLVVTHKMDRKNLIDGRNEGKLTALAHAVLIEPQDGDLQLLLQAAVLAAQKHVRYALAMAFARLIDDNKVASDDLPRVVTALRLMQLKADGSLLNRIDKTLALVEWRTIAA